MAPVDWASAADHSVSRSRKTRNKDERPRMKSELLCLVLVTAFTGLLWVPYVLDRMRTGVFFDRIGYARTPGIESPWACRLVRAHANAVENLVVFAPLVLTANALDISNRISAGACAAYLLARVVHALAYTLAVPWVRTIAFLVGFAAQTALALTLLARWPM